MSASIKKIYESQMKGMKEVVGKLKNKEERKKLLTDERMEPHIYLLKLLGLVLILSLVVGLIIK